MRLGLPRVTENGDTIRIDAVLESTRGHEVIWYEVDVGYAHAVVTDRSDGFVVTALLLAMERGDSELIIEGTISEMLLHNLQHQVVPIFRLLVPEFGCVQLRPAGVKAAGDHGRGVVTGFSGGVDSFCTIADYGRDSNASSGYRLTHLLFSNVGANGRGDRLFHERWALIKDVAQICGLEFVRVNSNLADLIQTRFERTHVARNASVVLLLQRLFGKYYYSSTYRFQDSYIGDTKDMAYADPATVHLFSTESLQVMSTGCQYSRVEKTRRALQVPIARQRLNVCVTPQTGTGRNCSRCFKCVRTLATLDLLGELESVDKVFDLSVYRSGRVRDQYLAMLPARAGDPFVREIFELARTREAALPPHVAAIHALWPIWRWPYAMLKRTRHLFASRQ